LLGVELSNVVVDFRNLKSTPIFDQNIACTNQTHIRERCYAEHTSPEGWLFYEALRRQHNLIAVTGVSIPAFEEENRYTVQDKKGKNPDFMFKLIDVKGRLVSYYDSPLP